MAEFPIARHGAMWRAEALARFGQHGLRRRLRDADLVPFLPRILVPRERLLNLRTRAAAALLWAGPEAVITGDTAARLHGCSAADAGAVHLLVPYHRSYRAQPAVRVHQGRHDPADVVPLDGLPVLRLELVLAELLCTARRRHALACADQALAARPSNQRPGFRSRIGGYLDHRLDRRGTIRGGQLLGLASGQPESPPESWLLLVVVDAGLPRPVSQYEVQTVDGAPLYRLDFAWPELRIALEYDGYAAHRERGERDAARDADLRRRGWIVVRVTMADLADPGRLLAELHRAFAQRMHGLALERGPARWTA